MARIWIAEHGLHCALKVGMYQDQGMDEARAWGIILSDMARHLGNALAESSQIGSEDALAAIVDRMLDELGHPTSQANGDFVGP